MNNYSHLRTAPRGAPGTHMGPVKGPVCPTCDDVLNSAVFPLINRSVVFGLPLAQFCNKLLLLLPLLLSLDLNQ